MSKQDELIGHRMKELRELLQTFDLRLHSYSPGVGCLTAKGEFLDFGRVEWETLEPLLIELRRHREESLAEE